MIFHTDQTYTSRNPLLKRYFWSRLRKMAEVADRCAPQTIFDIGCGKGQMLTILTRTSPESQYIGIDIGSDVREAWKISKSRRMKNTQFIRADCASLPIRTCSSNQSQIVFCASMLEHLNNVQPAMTELVRIMSTDGKLIIGLPTENRLYKLSRSLVGLRKPKDHFHSAQNVEHLLKTQFSRIRLSKLPFSFLPRFFSLYIVLVCGKGNP